MDTSGEGGAELFFGLLYFMFFSSSWFGSRLVNVGRGYLAGKPPAGRAKRGGSASLTGA